MSEHKNNKWKTANVFITIPFLASSLRLIFCINISCRFYFYFCTSSLPSTNKEEPGRPECTLAYRRACFQ